MFSVIIPLFNREKYISDTLESVLYQSFQNWECIVVDDGSSDNSYGIVENIARKDPRIKLFKRSRTPKNANTCRNIGIEKSTMKYLLFLDSDDLLLPNCLELRKRMIEENPNADLLISGTGAMKSDSFKSIAHYGRVYSKGTNFLGMFLSLHSPWFMTSGTWRKEFIQGINGFDEGLLRLQDPDIHIRALMSDKICLHYNYQEIDHLYRIHNQRIFSSKNVIQIRIDGYLKFFLKYRNYPGINLNELETGVNKTIVEFLYSNKETNYAFNQSCLEYFDLLLESGLINSSKHKSIYLLNKFFKYCPNFRGMGKLLYFFVNNLPKNLVYEKE